MSIFIFQWETYRFELLFSWLISPGYLKPFWIFREKFLFCNVGCLQKDFYHLPLGKHATQRKYMLNQYSKSDWTRCCHLSKASYPAGRQRITPRENSKFLASNGEGTIISPFTLFYKTSFSAVLHKEGANEPNKTALISLWTDNIKCKTSSTAEGSVYYLY